ncbi:DNA methyltransferase [Mycobacterium phage Cornie]|uniref:Uncharacterized protein n=1 Tax=Mycobacterium phage Cornie TaxID=2704043 RepID=A0A6G6XK93_9CAUD|nr:DNA methyltransferase [Mycobacterium phage Cornie]QIG58434.1 hypothetical protein SEA_CORNIE_59 [Mycobacterium phage Cornie]
MQSLLEALKANRIALVELPDPIVDEEWGGLTKAQHKALRESG